jgi:hypothetical protein
MTAVVTAPAPAQVSEPSKPRNILSLPNQATGPEIVKAAPAPAASETNGTANAAGTATEAKPLTPEEKQAQDFAKAQAAAAKARKASQRDQQKRIDQARIEQQQTQAQAELAQLRSRLEQSARLEQQLRADPLAALKALGISAEDTYKRAVQEGTPEAQLAAMRQEIEAERRERVALQQQLAQQSRTEQQKRVDADFVQAAQNEKLYPNIANQPAAFILSAARDLVRDAWERTRDPVTGRGRTFSREEILTALEALYSTHTKARSKTKDATSESASSSGTNGSGSPAPSRTISNALASSAWSKPANWDKISDREQQRLLAQALKGKLVTRRT